ncbi:HDOD domain-containing protein [Corallincola holothuriorum]|uniref:HDOD domain-containing protein n=1 Tax=Corallincola holothuriorum TaxID=2282215 RepID=A0A368NLT8_9GAMM|nr:HDOD domain-containing protein [Corallincola holothuriorum]RCU50291.1 HDOD domain-containing protein [Corallincola holothuriorum]
MAIQQMKGAMAALFNSEQHLLALPEQVVAVRRLCVNPNSDLYDVEETVLKDPAFSGYLLKLANSALYGTGKQTCHQVADAIRRIGIHAVGELAMIYAAKQLHDARCLDTNIAQRMRLNWQQSWSLGQVATELYWQHRHREPAKCRRLDASDILTAAVMSGVGSLAVLTAADQVITRSANDAGEDEASLPALSQDTIEDMLTLSNKYLQLTLQRWGMQDAYAQALVKPPIEDGEFHFTHYLWAAKLSTSPTSELGQCERTKSALKLHGVLAA